MTRDLKTYNCIVRLQRMQEPLTYKIEDYTIRGAASVIREEHALRGKDPHKGFRITEVS